MVSEKKLCAKMILSGISKLEASRALGISSRTFYNRLKYGNFTAREIEILTDILNFENFDQVRDIFLTECHL